MFAYDSIFAMSNVMAVQCVTFHTGRCDRAPSRRFIIGELKMTSSYNCERPESHYFGARADLHDVNLANWHHTANQCE